MDHTYSQLSEQERVQVFHLHANGISARAIGRRIGRHHSTISRELFRNGRATKQYAGGYEPVRAHGLAQRRRQWDCRFKLARQPDLRPTSSNVLRWNSRPSRSQAGWRGRRLACASAMSRSTASSSTVSASRTTPGTSFCRRRSSIAGGAPGKGVPLQKPLQTTSRLMTGPRLWKAAKASGIGKPTSWPSATTPKSSSSPMSARAGMKFAWVQPNKGAEAVRIKMCEHLLALPKKLCRSITYDNGTEFAQHHLINKATGTKSYFCHTHSPWQKGGVENAIGRLRRCRTAKPKSQTCHRTKSQPSQSGTTQHQENASPT